MTCNQLIVLLDVHRGFSRDRHLGTMDRDLLRLERDGLIRRGACDVSSFDYDLTDRGEEVVETVLKVANLAQSPEG